MQYSSCLVDSINAAIQAGAAILQVYQSDFDVELKSDRSPLTLADKLSHDIIKAGLAQHGLPMISEEGRDIPYAERSSWGKLWIVDPLDGTKEFVKRNGEFTVNIALVDEQQPVMGVVYAPVPDVLYFANANIGAFKVGRASELGEEGRLTPDQRVNLDALIENARKLPCVDPSRRAYTIVGSRSHGTAELAAFVEQKRQEQGNVEFIQAGSSLKICLVAEGAADIYPRLGPTMEWDTAAGQAVAQCAGARMHAYESGVALKYNKQDLLNPWFIVDR
jgi:3'(2'), 5'-bisphosphate nucleotidase